VSQDKEALKIKTRTAYNAAADHFDHSAVSFWEYFGEQTVARLNLARGMLVLDVGCGTGASALPAAKRVAPDGQVIGVDLAENMLEFGRAKAARMGLQNVEFRHGDMTNLGFPDGYFDAVISVFSIFFVTDMEALVRELWRMVRPGGQLAITTWGPDIFKPMGGRWQVAVKQYRPDLHSNFNPWDRITTPAALADLLQKGGVSGAEVVAENGSHPLLSHDDWWRIVLGSGYRWTVEQMGPEIAAQVRDDNLKWIVANRITAVETNVVYAIATKAPDG
jgi:ubiquinone/menaquinone biosynthesis C-methylase UbiE